MFTLAVNDALRRAQNVVMRKVRGFITEPDDTVVTRRSFSLPANMTAVHRVYEAGEKKLFDNFTRGNDTSSAGGDWSAAAGTWGISSNQLYSVTDTDGDLLLQDFTTKDPFIQCRVKGTLNHATTVRVPGLVFRYADSSNYYVVQLKNGSVDLRKVVGGSESSLSTGTLTTADGTEYLVQILVRGNRIQVWVDTTLYIDYADNTTFAFQEYTQAGFRLSKGGAPATAARWDGYWIFNCNVGEVDAPRWRADGSHVHFDRDYPVLYSNPRSKLLVVDGGSPLSQLASNSTAASPPGLITDETAKVEIATTDKEWMLLIAYAKAALYNYASNPAWNGDLPSIPYYLSLKQAAEMDIISLVRSLGEPAKITRGIW